MAQHNDFGNDSEAICRAYIQQKGYAILEANWKSGHREIDIIAQDGDTLVIIEVKARKENSLTNPEDAVDSKKIRNIVLAADNYVKQNNINSDVRFDIITLTPVNNEITINHIIDAFYPPTNY